MPSQYELRDLIESKDPNPEINLLRSESDRRMREAVLKVPPLYRMVLVLHDMEGLSTSEVARVTGLREGTVRVRLHRARLMLRRKLWLLDQAKPVRDRRHSRRGRRRTGRRRPRHCREMFASLSDYIDGLAEDARSREMEKHLSRLSTLRRVSRQPEVGGGTMPHLRTRLRYLPRRGTAQRPGCEIPLGT